jgi:SARP family transcriptional regulator, regulator of embCAB operon
LAFKARQNSGKRPVRGLQLKVFLAGRVAIETNGLVLDDARFPGRQGRLLFAYLVAAQGRPVPRDELADALWEGAPPATWDKALAVLASKLRGVLAEAGLADPNVLTSAFGCYQLDLPAGSWVDVIAASNAVQEADDALAADNLKGAKAAAALAASLAQQTFLPGEDRAWVEERRRDLADLRARALSTLAEACLRLNEKTPAVKWAEQALALEPFRESGYRLLMEAHAAAGNRAEALRVYDKCRRLLADELGTYPSPETEAIYRRLLETPPRVAPERAEPPVSPPMARRRRRLVPAAVAVLALAGAVAAFTIRGSAGPVPLPPNSVGVIDPKSSRVVAAIPVGDAPTHVALSKDAVWVLNSRVNTISRIDPRTRKVVRTFAGPFGAIDIVAGAGSLWVTTSAYAVARVDPMADEVVHTIPLGKMNPLVGPILSRVVASGQSVWTTAPGAVVHVAPAPVRRLRVADVTCCSAIAVGDGALWTTAQKGLDRVDPSTGQLTHIPLPFAARAVAYGDGAVWLTDQDHDSVWQINAKTNQVIRTIGVRGHPTDVVVGAGAVWVATSSGMLVKINESGSGTPRAIKLGATPSSVAVGDGFIWTTVD